ncbi:MAG TPA: division/cell wall cluster transcriptional repressor MraZ [Chitinophagaceae bacterium]|nr:division/cell wall cluster transcriptional repressor MraZ [Chitinophagaceae bacterium]
MHFLGEYESTVDSKGRFLLPAGFKKQLPDGETRFVISRGFEECLTLYPMQVWKPLHARISNLNQFDPKVRQFQRQFLGGATEVELDSAGRLLLPASLKGHAKLEKDITLVAQGDKLEIWDTANYKKLFDSFDANAFSVLANEVMGQQQIG